MTYITTILWNSQMIYAFGIMHFFPPFRMQNKKNPRYTKYGGKKKKKKKKVCNILYMAWKLALIALLEHYI